VSIVRSYLVRPDQYTGKEVTCILVDQCVKKCPQAEINVKTDWYTGKLPVVCMDKCIYNLIVGNDIYSAMHEKETEPEMDEIELVEDGENCDEMHHKYIIFENSNLSEKEKSKVQTRVKELNYKECVEKAKCDEENIICGHRAGANCSTEKTHCDNEIAVLRDQTILTDRGQDESSNHCGSDCRQSSLIVEVMNDHYVDTVDTIRVSKKYCEKGGNESQTVPFGTLTEGVTE